MDNVKLTQDWVMIIDTETGEHMSGVKGQSFYANAGKAKRSANHTSWWQHYRRNCVVIGIGRKDLIDQEYRIQDELDKYRAVSAPTPDNLKKAFQDNQREIVAAREKYNKDNPALNVWAKSAASMILDSIKFSTQTRFKIVKVLAIQVEDL